ncbi:hypothetical protein EVAR_46556_1 [Eumeta japonica]|uniref:Uncharacterized protein n=1 Tax=Eumeta variegata TaxID=151549 RepID=A0A4C1XQW1_EUMVA|nr:hypothetical protein EVAR_46556_1 [Eumeta japonica]
MTNPISVWFSEIYWDRLGLGFLVFVSLIFVSDFAHIWLDGWIAGWEHGRKDDRDPELDWNRNQEHQSGNAGGIDIAIETTRSIKNEGIHCASAQEPSLKASIG